MTTQQLYNIVDDPTKTQKEVQAAFDIYKQQLVRDQIYSMVKGAKEFSGLNNFNADNFFTDYKHYLIDQCDYNGMDFSLEVIEAKKRLQNES